ncbi:MAG: phosphoethanolamine--lipid A transferase [Marinomonas sp.]|jgi:lipid A ethanolaminephosphotransferase|uniref:phosphoethanolamine transferase n=1 Tax=Marinomonas TaxID=28253 RepID=UPI001054329D|nr:phosphoethanolamine--lipid A transferase [Marinomonas sp. KMM3893]
MSEKKTSQKKEPRFQLSYSSLSFILAIYYTLVVNLPFYRELKTVLTSIGDMNVVTILPIPLFLLLILNIIFNLFSWPYVGKAFFIFLLITSSIVSYTMLFYGINVDYGMIENALETDSSEAASYLNLHSISWITITGVIPSLLVAFAPMKPGIALLRKAIAIGLSVILLLLLLFFSYKDLSAVGRNHGSLKRMIIPTYYLYSAYNYLHDTYFTRPIPFKHIGEDATLSNKSSNEKPTLFFFILGETARSQNYALNGYAKNTNPYTKEQNVISFQSVHSCGTATAVSVPCMFSQQGRHDYNKKRTYNQDNVMDILQRAGVSLLWKENDGGDKDVAKRIPKIVIDRSRKDQFCNGSTCLDMALLQNLDSQIAAMKGKDKLLVMHVMGSHGPTYYLRYPKEQEKFLPDCQSSEIEDCSVNSIVNTYDNTIVYTDYVISQAINKLKSLSGQYNTALFYISDHGESLGEDGLFLHGVPYAVAPAFQTTVPLILWLSDGFKQSKHIDEACLRKEAKKGDFSQDYVFSSLLGIMDVKTNAYDKNLDIYQPCRD